jgi:hypothetical protein
LKGKIKTAGGYKWEYALWHTNLIRILRPCTGLMNQ